MTETDKTKSCILEEKIENKMQNFSDLQESMASVPDMQDNNNVKKSQFYMIISSKNSVLFVASFAIFTDMLIYSAIVPLMKNILTNISYDGDKFQGSGILFGVYAVGLFVSTPILGVISDVYQNRKTPMLLGLLGLCGTTMLFAFSTNFTGLVIARILQGISAAATWVLGMAMVADVFISDSLARAMSIVSASNTMGFCIGPLIGGLLSHKISYKAPFYFCTALAFVDFIARIIIKPPKPHVAIDINVPTFTANNNDSVDSEAIPKKKSLWNRIKNCKILMMLKHIEIIMLCVAVVIGASSFSILEAVISVYLYEEFKLDELECGIIMIFFVVPNVLTSLVIGHLGDKIRRTRIMIIGAVLHMFAPILLGLANKIGYFELAAFYYGASVAIFFGPISPEIGARAAALGYKTSFARVYAILNMSYSLSMFVFPLIGPVVLRKFGFLGVMCMISLMLFLFLPFFLYLTFKMERKHAGLECGMRTVLRNASSQFLNFQAENTDNSDIETPVI